MNVGFLLFSSMLKPSEIFLSKEIKDNAKVAKDNTKSLKARISKRIDKRNRKKSIKESTLDSEIEIALNNIKNTKQKNVVDKLLTKERVKDSKPRFINYKTTADKISSDKKSAFKNPYKAFVNYIKSGYRTIKKSKKIPDLNPEQVGYELDKYSKRFKLIRAPKINGKSYLVF